MTRPLVQDLRLIACHVLIDEPIAIVIVSDVIGVYALAGLNIRLPFHSTTYCCGSVRRADEGTRTATGARAYKTTVSKICKAFIDGSVTVFVNARATKVNATGLCF